MRAGARGLGVLAVALLAAATPVPTSGAQTTTPEGGGPGTITVSPPTNLVHGDTVRVRGAGWHPQEDVVAQQCVAGTEQLLSSACEGPFNVRPVGPGGRFGYQLRVEVIIDDLTPVDCRVSTCEIVVWGNHVFPTSATARYPLHFDPEGPDPARPTVTVMPATDLVHDQTVEVAVDGVATEPGGSRWVEVRLCLTPAAGGRCSPVATSTPVTSDGHVEVSLTVESLVLLPAGHHDCRTGGCEIRASVENEPSETGTALLDFDPVGTAPPAPLIDVQPTTDLADGQRVTIAGTGLLAEDEVFMSQCVGSTDTCGIVTDAGAVVGNDGGFTASLRARAVLETDGADVDCRLMNCVIAFFATFGLDRVEVPITFDPDAPLLEPRIVVRPRQDLTSSRTVRVHGTDFVPFQGYLGIDLCVGMLGPNGQGQNARCDRRLGESYRAGSSFSVDHPVRRFIRVPAYGEVDCRVRICRLWASEYYGADAVPSERLLFRAGT